MSIPVVVFDCPGGRALEGGGTHWSKRRNICETHVVFSHGLDGDQFCLCT